MAQSKDDCVFNINRLSGNTYIHPILFAERSCESGKLASLKAQVQAYIDEEKNNGIITSASVYIENFDDDAWTAVNADEKYNPGSLLKVVTLMTWLKNAESSQHLLDKELPFPANTFFLKQTFNSKTIEAGHSYKIKDLLHYMIAYSDNKATAVLNNNMNVDIFKRIFAQLGLIVPDLHDMNFQISAPDYSRFMKTLYNASYLSIPASEYATELLSECNFKDGILRGIPNSVRIAHKFGESMVGKDHELHESAIVYINNKPYLITIMTKGPDVRKLPEVLSIISRITYDFMSQGSDPAKNVII